MISEAKEWFNLNNKTEIQICIFLKHSHYFGNKILIIKNLYKSAM